jgi:epoxyqueuosine reductase
MPASATNAAETLEARIVRAALELGFARAGIAPALRSEQAAERLSRWLADGHHGEMQYMTGAVDRAAPASLYESARSVLVVAMPYGGAPLHVRRSSDGPALPLPLSGTVARYAQGEAG